MVFVAKSTKRARHFKAIFNLRATTVSQCAQRYAQRDVRSGETKYKNSKMRNNDVFPRLARLAERLCLVPSTLCHLHAATCLLKPYAPCPHALCQKKSGDNPATKPKTTFLLPGISSQVFDYAI
jgi:hypothetical protein